MLLKISLGFLFFLPIIESFNRQIAFNLLLSASILLSFSSFWKKKIQFDVIELLWILVLILFTLSATLSWSLSRSYFELLRYFAYFLIFVSIRRFPDSQNLLRRFFIPMVIVNSIILSFLFILSPFLNLPQPENKMSLFEPFYMGHNHLADILIFAIPVAFFLRRKFLSLVLSLFFISMLVFTFSRGAMISLSLVFLLFALVKNHLRQASVSPRLNRGHLKKIGFAIYPHRKILVIAALTTIFLIASFIYSNFFNSSATNSNNLKRLYKPAVKENRLKYAVQAWKGFRESPIFGSGLDTFRYVSKIYQSAPYTWSWYTHNHFLQIFTETGFLGGVLFSVLIASLSISAFNNFNYQLPTTNYQQGLFISALASTIHSLIDFDWQYISVFLIFFMSTGFLNSPKVIKVEKKPDFLFFLLISVILIMFTLPLLFKFDSDMLITESDKLINKNYLNQAGNILMTAYRFDYKNQEISKRLGDLEAKIGSSDSAHLWYKNAILQDQYYAESIIKNDFRLYLVQAKSALDNKDYKAGYNYLVKSAKTYPLFYQWTSGDYFLFNANKLNSEKKTYEARRMLLDYINLANRTINIKRLSPEEILAIAPNLKQNVY